MAAQTFFLPFRPAIDANGLTIPGAQLCFYATGTTTEQAVYANSTLTTPLVNPVVANAAGRWPVIHLDESLAYRVVLKDSAGVTLAETDPYDGSLADSLSADLQTIANSAIVAKVDAIAQAQSAAISATSATASATTSANLAQFLLVLGRYYATRAAGVAATTAGQLFSSDETGSLVIYKNISTTPFYSVVSTGGASVTSVAASGGTTGFSFTGGPITSSGTLTLAGTLGLANGGTGATTAAAARTALAAAASGANADITSLTGLTTPISVSRGGTGATTAAASRTALGAAASGANSDITSLTALSTVISIAQGGTGQSTAAAALAALGGLGVAASDIAGATGYIKFANGLMLQWQPGSSTVHGSSVTYNQPYNTWSLAWLNGLDAVNNRPIKVNSSTTTAATIYNTYNASVSFTLFAIGV